jgi:Bacterial TniB protein
MTATRDERIATIRGGCWIRYSRAESILNKLEELLLLPKTHRMSNFLLVGETNNGKTALVNHFVCRHQPQFSDQDTPAHIPIVVVQAPPVPDEGRLYQAILRQLFPPCRPSQRIDLLQREALRLLQAVDVKALIIDEIHHVLAGSMLKQRHFLNVIKYMGNELKIPLIAVGTHDAFNAVQSDPQLANRFEPATLPRWTMGKEYLRLLMSFEKALPLKHASTLVDQTLALKILGLSEGTIGEIATLLQRAALHAIERRVEQITGTILDGCGYVSPSERRRMGAFAV